MLKIVFDGIYYKHVLKYSFGEPKLDIGRVVNTMRDIQPLYSAKYYFPVRKITNLDSDFERTRAKHLEEFLYKIAEHNIEIGRTTDLACYGDQRDWPDLYPQMCVDIMRLVFSGRVDTLVLLAESRSLIPTVVAARAEGVRVQLWHGPSRTPDLRELMLHADKAFLITEDLIQEWRRIAA